MFIYILFVISTLALFYTFFLVLAKLVTAGVTLYDVLLSWAAYIAMIITYYLAQQYLLRTFIESLAGSFITMLAWSNGVFPLIAFIITFFIKSTQKKKVMTPQEIGGFSYG